MKLVYQFTTEVVQSIPARHTREVLRALNRYHLGSDNIPHHTLLPEPLREAHRRAQASWRVLVVVSVYEDGSFTCEELCTQTSPT